MNKKHVLLCLLAACTTQYTYTLDDFDDFTDLDSFTLPEEDITSLTANAELDLLNMTRSLQPGQYYGEWFATIYAGTDIIKPGGLQLKSTLLSDWYYNTDPIATRNILFYPFNVYSYYRVGDNHTFDLNIFFNKTDRKYFTPSSYNIESYVNIKNANFDDILQSFSEDTQANVLNDLDILGNGTIEERRMGGTLGYFYTYDDWLIYMQLPIMYAERNFQYTQAEKDAIQASLLFQGLAGGSETFKDFVHQHFVMDQVGFGTLQIGFSKKVHAKDDDHFFIEAGAYTQLPTEFPIAQGIVGTWFEPANNVPLLDFSAINPNNLINDTLTPDEKAAIKTFFLDAIDHLASDLLRVELGNVRHFNIGGTFHLYWKPHSRIYFLGDVQAQYYFAAKEDRFFMQTPSNTLNNLATQVNAIADPIADAPQTLKDAVVNQVSYELYNRMILTVCKAEVRPGMMINTNFSMHVPFADEKWQFILGANNWFKLKEKLQSIIAPTDILPYLDKTAATGYFMYQLKPFVSLDYKGSSLLDTISLYADYTIAQRAIGKDYTIALSVNLTF